MTIRFLCLVSLCWALLLPVVAAQNADQQPQIVNGKPVQVTVLVRLRSDTKPLTIKSAEAVHFFSKESDDANCRVAIIRLERQGKDTDHVMTAPRLRTLAGQQATMRVMLAGTSLETAYIIDVLPRIDADGGLKLAYDSTLLSGIKEDIVLARHTGAYKMQPGESIVLLFHSPNKERYYSVELTPEIVRD